MKSQAGIEFLVYSSLLILILIIFLLSSSSKQQELIILKIDNEMKDIASDIAFEINEAVRAGDGYERRFNLNKYDIKNFEIIIEDSTLIVKKGERRAYANIITSNIIGNFTGNWNRINNTRGIIYVN